MKPPTLYPGDRIAGKYRIVKRLGSGGMGVVFLAQHERLDRSVAIKVLHAQGDHMLDGATRFEREIKAMALVGHQHVAHAFDADMLEDGSLYLVMEYLEGRDLREERKLRGTIPFPEAVAYIRQACEGIAAVHEVGIIHRDLKPHNLFLTQLAGPRCIKVLDFGVAKFLVGADVTMTDENVAVGTPLYMSPEQLNSPKNVGTWSDVWSLAVVLYELVAGVSPFAADTPGEVIAAVVLDSPVPLMEMAPHVPEQLSRIIDEALIKSTQKRIGSAREFAARLAPFSLPTGEIFASSAPPSEAPALLLIRESQRPEMAARIRDRVAEFDENVQPAGQRAHPDQLRQLPSLARLTIGPTIPAAPWPRRATANAGSDAVANVSTRPTPTQDGAAPSGAPVASAAAPLVPIEQLARSTARERELLDPSRGFRGSDPGCSRANPRKPPVPYGPITLALGLMVAALIVVTRFLQSPAAPPASSPRTSGSEPIAAAPRSVAAALPHTVPESQNPEAVPASSLGRTSHQWRRPQQSQITAKSSNAASTSPNGYSANQAAAPIATAADGRPLHL